jgi:D-3-phosphoglycerate dehydrogenase
MAQRLSLRVGPELAGAAPALLASAAAGVLEGTIDVERINLINARSIAEARGIELSTTESDALGHPAAMLVSVSGGVQLMAVAAVAPSDAPARLIRIGGFHIDVAPREALIILTNNDVPGVIGRVGTLLGDRGVNIAEYHQARLAQGGEALAAISVDGTVASTVRDELLGLQDVCTATVVQFRGA